MKAFGRIFVGLTAYLLCSLYFKALWVVLLFSVVCTWGATLILWLPAFWLIGSFVLALFDPSTYDFAGTVDEKQAEKSSNKSMMAFISYIRRERAAGVSDQQISLASKDAGWLDSDIQFAFKSADSVK